MNILDKIKKPILEELAVFEKTFADTVISNYQFMGDMIANMVELKGKRMRPILSLLVAKMLGGVKNQHNAAAVILELTHNASLVHDDIIDKAFIRRGKPTLNAIVGNKGAVLAGDFLLASGIEIGVKNGHYKAIEVAAKILKELVEGEMLQALRAEMLDCDVEKYYNIINLKTANLIASSAKVGAYDNGLDEEQIEQFYSFGQLIGQAYQIKDDILDYLGNESGKQLFNDIREKKITLPLLYAFELNEDKQKIINILKQDIIEEKDVQVVAQYVIKSNAIDMCYQEIEKIKNNALQILQKYPQNDANDALKLYCHFVTNRDY